eukprot:jgi/Bigna1/84232/fgenesh1_pg.127_\
MPLPSEYRQERGSASRLSSAGPNPCLAEEPRSRDVGKLYIRYFWGNISSGPPVFDRAATLNGAGLSGAITRYFWESKKFLKTCRTGDNPNDGQRCHLGEGGERLARQRNGFYGPSNTHFSRTPSLGAHESSSQKPLSFLPLPPCSLAGLLLLFLSSSLWSPSPSPSLQCTTTKRNRKKVWSNIGGTETVMSRAYKAAANIPIAALRNRLRNQGMPTTGIKPVLEDRLIKAALAKPISDPWCGETEALERVLQIMPEMKLVISTLEAEMIWAPRSNLAAAVPYGKKTAQHHQQHPAQMGGLQSQQWPHQPPMPHYGQFAPPPPGYPGYGQMFQSPEGFYGGFPLPPPQSPNMMPPSAMMYDSHPPQYMEQQQRYSSGNPMMMGGGGSMAPPQTSSRHRGGGNSRAQQQQEQPPYSSAAVGAREGSYESGGGRAMSSSPPVGSNRNELRARATAPTRPGDWICDRCGFLNWNNRNVCKRCGYGRPMDRDYNRRRRRRSPPPAQSPDAHGFVPGMPVVLAGGAKVAVDMLCRTRFSGVLHRKYTGSNMTWKQTGYWANHPSPPPNKQEDDDSFPEMKGDDFSPWRPGAGREAPGRSSSSSRSSPKRATPSIDFNR